MKPCDTEMGPFFQALDFLSPYFSGTFSSWEASYTQFIYAANKGEDLKNVAGAAWISTVNTKWGVFTDWNLTAQNTANVMQIVEGDCYTQIYIIDSANLYWDVEEWWVQN